MGSTGQGDAVNRDNFTQYNTVIHDNYFHDSEAEGFYIGGASYETGQTLACPGGEELVFPPELRGVEVYNNIVENAGWEGIEVKSAIEACNIHHNRVTNYTTQGVVDNGGIALAHGSVCNIYNNFIKDGKGAGIEVTGYGGNKVYNNVIINAGKGQLGNHSGAGIIVSNTGNPDNNVYVWHNTIVNPLMQGIDYRYEKGSDNRIENNLIVNPGNGVYIDINGQTNVTLGGNFKAQHIDEVKFTDPASDDYSLQPDSPAIDTGVNPNLEINTDYMGVTRPAGLNYDAGAYEFVPASN